MTSYSNNDPLDLDWWSTVDQQQQQQEEDMTMSPTNNTLMQRLLKKAGEYQRPDYSVLSVTVMTLGLIIMVEFVKHKIDHMAHGKRYFTAVLQTLYAELTILGIVEFFVWLIQEYYENMNKDKKQVFAQVHFALFYTAIFNALQSIILYYIVGHLSQKLWIQTEALELAHYVEIREEFDLVSQELYQYKKQKRRIPKTSNNNNNNKQKQCNGDHSNNSSSSDVQHDSSLRQQQQQQQDQEDKQNSVTAEFAFEYNWTGIQFLCHTICQKLATPRHLSNRYQELLIQVRFHELRVHFIQAYQLPSNFRVSAYLVRSEEAVLIKLLHVTTYAWLFLTASANLLYYILGIIVTETGNLQLPGQILIYIYYICLALFIIVALTVYNKMKLIFKNIMHRNHLWDDSTTITPEQQHDHQHNIDSSSDEEHDNNHNHHRLQLDSYSSKKEALEAEQLALFWASSPKLVITAIQFMQFGYAVALSVVIIFWTEINDASINMAWYLFAIVICYGLFVYICAQTVPRYTLCTSLGQLVDKKRLHETVAIHRLDEARKKAAAAASLQAATAHAHHHQDHYHHDDDDKPQPSTLALCDNMGSPGKNDDDDPLSQSAHGFNRDDHEVPSSALVLKNTRSRHEGGEGSRIYYGRPNTISNSMMTKRSNTQHSMAAGDLAFSNRASSTSGGGSVGGRSTGSGSESIAMMVKMDTHTLRSLLPSDELEKLSLRDQKKNAKRRGGAAGTTRSGRQKAMSTGVAAMAGIREEPEIPERPLVQNNLDRQGHQKQLPQPPAPEITSNEDDDDDEASDRLSPLDTTPANLRARRRRSSRSQKSVSDGVALMAAISAHEDDDYSNSGVGGNKSSSAIEPPVPLTISSRATADVYSSDNASIAQMALMVPRDERPEEPEVVAPITPSNNNDRNELVEYNDDNVPEYANYLHKDGKHGPSTGEHVQDMSSEIVEYKKPHAPRLSFLERCRLYYKSKKYVVVSNVFGTMFAFFLVATRVERFLHTENIIPSGMFVSFQFDQRPSFWLLSSWMYMFILNDSLLILALPGYSSLRRFRERRVWVSALIDMAIVYACIMVFNIAEAERCCYPTDGDDAELDASDYDLDSQTGVRFLAYDTKDGYAAKDDSYGEKGYTIGIDPHPCDCPMFGSRLYGGLGHIEPYTSLLALRLFRFWAAGVIVRFLDGHQGKVKSKTERVQEDKDRKRLNPMDVHGEEHHNDHGHGHHHHEESGTAAELWEATVAGHPELVAKYGEFSREVLLAMLNIPIVEEKPKHTRDPSLTASRITSSSLETENINDKKIIVKATTTTKPERNDTKVAASGMTTISPLRRPSLSRSSSLFFKSDDSKLAYDNFQEPDAPLVLSMHRCERKFLPILENWTTVDVVMTPYEIVYFDVGPSRVNDKTNSVVEGAIRQALMATKGGKGLSLCAVASIRRVVGHVRFSDVTGIAVDKSRSAAMMDPNRPAGAVASECIQIQTSASNGNNTLCLKFYCNSLVEHRDNNGNLEQWVDMIRLYCGLELSPSLNVTAYKDDDDESFVEV